jgi:hypothetical protein
LMFCNRTWRMLFTSGDFSLDKLNISMVFFLMS